VKWTRPYYYDALAVIRETIHKHIVEEVQKVNLHERHLTYIQQHVQVGISVLAVSSLQFISPGPQRWLV
jgi:hypothetical protein